MPIDHSGYYTDRIAEREEWLYHLEFDHDLIKTLIKGGMKEHEAEKVAASARQYAADVATLCVRLHEFAGATILIARMAHAALPISLITEAIHNTCGLVPTDVTTYPIPLEATTDEFLEARGEDLVFIRSREHSAWWKQGSGYTSDMNKAGVFTLDEAFHKTVHCGMEKQIWFENFAASKVGIAAAEVGPLFGRQF